MINRYSKIIPIEYQAKNPALKNQSWIEFFKSFFSSPSGISIGVSVLPAQFLTTHYVEEKIREVATKYNVLIEQGFITTSDDVDLATIQITPIETAKENIAKKKYIIKFNGNGMEYQDRIIEMAYDATHLGSTVIGFNYRNVANSEQRKPKKFADLLSDGIAQVERLLDSGADPNKITLDGISLGGAVATATAAYFHQQKIRINLWCDRAPATLAKAAAGILSPKNISKLENTFSKVMDALKWNGNFVAYYNSIPATHKGYMVVAKQSEHSKGDGVIGHFASLHNGVKDKEKQTGIITGHKVLATNETGHNLPRHRLLSKEDPSKTAQDIFESFVMRNRKH